MYTLSGNYYKSKSVFRKETFWVLPPDVYTAVPAYDQEKNPSARIFHTCPELRRGQHVGTDVGIVFFQERTEDIKCDRCHKVPHDDVLTVYTLLKEA